MGNYNNSGKEIILEKDGKEFKNISEENTEPNEQALNLLRNLNIGESVWPGFKNMVLDGEIVVPLWALLQIENMPKKELKNFIWGMHDMKSDSSFEYLENANEFLATCIKQFIANKNKIVGVIYILTNKSFPEYVKIGFTHDINRRIKELNSSECVPYAFKVYALYEVNEELADKEIHKIIDILAPNLRASDIDSTNGKIRTKEFFKMSAEEAFSILESIAIINGNRERLKINPNLT